MDSTTALFYCTHISLKVLSYYNNIYIWQFWDTKVMRLFIFIYNLPEPQNPPFFQHTDCTSETTKLKKEFWINFWKKFCEMFNLLALKPFKHGGV